MKIPANWELTSYDIIKDKIKRGFKCTVVETDNEAMLIKVFKNVKGKVYYYESDAYSVTCDTGCARRKYYLAYA
jgi:hypothetical protein